MNRTRFDSLPEAFESGVCALAIVRETRRRAIDSPAGNQEREIMVFSPEKVYGHHARSYNVFRKN
jgi:hypothetical protein